MRFLAPLLLLAAVARPAPAGLIPYYRMDSLAFLASDVVLVDEVKYEKKTEPWVGGHDYNVATVTVVRALKGSCKPKDRLTIDVDPVYTRSLKKDASSNKRAAIPPGRALFFLKKDDKGTWRPVTGGVKLIIAGEAYCYGQFVSNPGGLWLARMAPENIKVADDAAYGEQLLLKDLAAALDKAKGLTKAEGRWAIEPGIIRKATGKK